ncbi:hypothetical protein [Sphingobacterium thalpophilum]|uniref:Lipoprotein n=1 Tax=Sphingobacterium thalpophilum TaxID=259 RepID=A0A4U9VX43_9SPHI|nr:hypothetical protein [Sphingobacterium thalpophilum]VTR48224.1 Uncharacterised protein [Sphingobacterium thalpophilum]
MKIYFISFFAVFISLGSCKQKSKQQSEKSNNTDTSQVSGVTDSLVSVDFNMDRIPVSAQDIGIFPYLSTPSGYRYADEKQKTLEEKYFFYNDSLVRKVSGQYFHATIFSQGDAFEDTYLVGEYKKAIANLGGIEIYSGGLPSRADELIKKENPAYVSDMYDPRPYKYKQFLIRTPKENIWIELCHGLNADQVDLTVVKETATNENEISKKHPDKAKG